MTNAIVSKTIFIKASRETVWTFLVDKDRLGDWYHPAKRDLTLGEDYALVEKGGTLEKCVIWGRVLEMKPPERLVTTFNIAPFNGAETVVTWLLQEVAGGSRLTLTHEGIAEASGDSAMEMLEFLEKGWESHLQCMWQAVTKLD
ncbi:SRPBCC domain-containing protein [Roseibium sp. SCPC15]|uniref:SRPBCC family protein n=1 Tax=Roseibium sp. SCP15 TaxID=3141376 RepID=UPI003338F2D2